MEWVKSYKNCIQSKETTAPTLLFPILADLIDETIIVSDEVWMWVHQKYGMSRILKNCIWLKETTALTLLFPTMIYLIDEKIHVSD